MNAAANSTLGTEAGALGLPATPELASGVGRLSKPPPEVRDADQIPQTVQTTDGARSAEEAKRKDWAKASRIPIHRRLPLEVLSAVSQAVRAAPSFSEELIKELDERFDLRRNYRISPPALRRFLFRIYDPRASAPKTLLAGFRQRQDSVPKIIDKTFGVKAKENPHLWEKQAFLTLVGLVFERLSTDDKKISTEELVTLSKLLAEQRRADAQSSRVGTVEAAQSAKGEGETTRDVGDAVQQLYGTNFQSPGENVESIEPFEAQGK